MAHLESALDGSLAQDTGTGNWGQQFEGKLLKSELLTEPQSCLHRIVNMRTDQAGVSPEVEVKTAQRPHRGWLPWMTGMLALFVLSGTQAASFDCAKAQSKVEHLVCDNQEISKLDEELSAAYKVAAQDKQRAASVKQAQKKWLRERNNCADAACVKRAYEMRLSALSGEKPETSTPAAQANEKISTPSQVEEVCIAPKIDWRNYEWTLMRGSGQPVCEEMLAYVKSRPNDVAPPTCPEERLPPNGNWSRPDSRILSEAEKQALLRDIPERFQQKPRGPGSYEQRIRSTKRLHVIRGDITRDGVPESFLAFGRSDDYRQTCETSKRCARPEETFKKGIALLSDAYDLLPLNDGATQINSLHRTAGAPSTPRGGELIFFNRLPYWLTPVRWSQNLHDDFSHSSIRPNDPYSAIFSLSEIFVGTDKQGDKSPNFKDVTVISMEYDVESNRNCRFGYFHHDNLKQNSPKR